MVLRLVREVGVITAIDKRLHLLKVHTPQQESDHEMTNVINMLCGGTQGRGSNRPF
jgi:hypothetical protein